jgi:multidrug resistance efflux pump
MELKREEQNLGERKRSRGAPWKWILIGAAATAIVTAAVVLFFIWPFGGSVGELRLPGVVEIQEVRLGPRVGGRVKEICVIEGDLVKKDRVLVKLQAPELDAQLAQWQAQLQQTQAQLERVQLEGAPHGPRSLEISAAAAVEEAARARLLRLRIGSRPEEIRSAESDLALAEADERLASKELERQRKMLGGPASTPADYDAAAAAYERGRAQAASLRAKRDLVVAGNRIEDIEEGAALWRQAKANHQLLIDQTQTDVQEAAGRVAQAQAKVDELQTDLNELVVTAPEPAVVEVLAVRPGDLVAPNQPIVRVLRTSDLWIKVYVPETDLGKVRLDQAVTATVDSYPNQPLQGRIVQILSESEFTPRNVQSVDERRHQVFGVRVRVDDPQGIFKSGMAAEVVIPLRGDATERERNSQER